MRSPRHRRCSWIALVALVALLAGQRGAQAQQASFTTPACYDTSVLGKRDWQALGESFHTQGFRGSMALIFPDRAPITDPARIKKWVEERPLLGFVFPGLNADAVGTWALAKQFAVANRQPGQARPVVAINSGWTDLGMGFGHFYELSGIRSAVNQGQADTHESMSNQVAEMIKARVAHQRAAGKPVDPILVGGHSSGGFYSANVAWLLDRAGAQYTAPLRVHNISISTRLPERVRAVQEVGTKDMVGLANSCTSALLQRSTRLQGGLSHNGGTDWTFGDSMARQRWRVTPLRELLGSDRANWGRRSSLTMIHDLRLGAKKSLEAASEARKLAKENGGTSGVEKVVALRLDHDATMLELRAQRQDVLASLLEARHQQDRPRIAAARAELRALRQQRQATRTRLQSEASRVYRTMLTDSSGFIGQMMTETALSMTPWKLWSKSVRAAGMGAQMGLQWVGAVMNNPLTNPWATPGRAERARVRASSAAARRR